jgi:Tfp pilus assembly protein PilN
MRSTEKVALGIDVTETQMNMVLLRKDRDHFTVLRTVQVPVPEATIDNGHVVDPAKLARALKAAKRRNRIRGRYVAVSLPAAVTLARIVPLHEEDPQRIAQFVSSEVQQYAALSGRETVSDFRVLTPARHSTPGKVLIVATDHRAVSGLVATCRSAGLRCSIIEPPVVACVRALRPTGPDSANGNLLLALLKNNTLTVCLCVGETLGFVRTKGHALADAPLETIYAWVADEINAVLRFQGIERGEESERWAVTVVDEDHSSIPEDAIHSLKAKVTAGIVSVATQAEPPDGVMVGPHGKGAISPTALGLAMRLLAQDERIPNVNLIPVEGTGNKSVRRAVLLAAIAMSVLILVMLLGTGVLSFMVKQVNRSIVALKQAELARNQRTLAAAATELAYVEQRTDSLSGELEYLGRIAESRVEVDWVQLLSDMKTSVPEVLRITELSAEGNSEMLIQGISHSYESVHVFVQMLNRSACIGRASIVQTRRDDAISGLVRYAIKCSLSPKEAQ